MGTRSSASQSSFELCLVYKTGRLLVLGLLSEAQALQHVAGQLGPLAKPKLQRLWVG